MPSYTVSAVKKIFLTTTVEANSREEAFKILDEEYFFEDFEQTGTDFTFTHIS